MEFKNLKKFSTEDSKAFLLSGNVSINNTKKSGIVIPPINDKDCNIVIPQNLSHLLHLISSAPITKTNINIFDQEGNLFNKYLSTRETNKPGNLFYKTSSKMSLNSIVIPEGENNFLLLPDYIGAESCKLYSFRETFIELDYPSNFESKNLTIFTTKKIIDFKVKFPSDVKVLVFDSDSFLESVIEYFFGKHFGDPSTFIKTLIPNFPCESIVSSVKDSNLSVSCRKEGKVEFYTKHEEASSDFVILLKSENYLEDSFSFTYDSDKVIVFENTNDENISKVLSYAEIYYDYKMNESKINFNEFFKKNSLKLLNFMIVNDFSEFTVFKNQTDFFFTKIHDNLFSLINQNFSKVHITNRMPSHYHSPLQINDFLRQESGGGAMTPD